MAEKHNFRSAFNGFHREDVVRYIEFITSKHNNQVNQLTAENEQLRKQLAEAEAVPSQDPLTLQMLAHAEAERDQFRAQAEELRTHCAQLERQLESAISAEEVQARIDQAKLEADARVAAAMEQVAAMQQKADRELDAYRRAERTERLARERAERVYRQANVALSNASTHVESAAEQIGGMADQLLSQLDQLRGAVSGSRDALSAAADALHTIHPGDEEE